MRSDDPVLDMVLASARMTAFAGGQEDVIRMAAAIEPLWLEAAGRRVHVDVHRAAAPKATIVFQPGSGAHARVYFLMAGLLARRGYHVLVIDRPGHGASDGARGDCTIDEALAASAAAIEEAASRWRLPVVLMGSSMGGLLTVFALLRGQRPDLAVAHNFVYPGKLASFRLRARWIRRYRTKPYPLTELVHGFERLSDDPAVIGYMTARTDPAAAWELTAGSVASMFGFNAKAPATAPPLLLISGARDTAIPAWATRFFGWWSGLRDYDFRILPDCGHLLFHDHLDVSVPLIDEWLDHRLAGQGEARWLDRANGNAARPRGVGRMPARGPLRPERDASTASRALTHCLSSAPCYARDSSAVRSPEYLGWSIAT